jgi:hypothetical protein
MNKNFGKVSVRYFDEIESLVTKPYAPTINWSALGDVELADALLFKLHLEQAIDFCSYKLKQFNRGES